MLVRTDGYGSCAMVADVNVELEMTRGTENQGGPGEARWGNQGSGGSVIDERTPN